MAGIPQVITEDRASGAQFIDGSLKFDSSKGQYLKRTPTANGNRKLWTWSGWLKQTPGGSEQDMFSAGQQVTNDGRYSRFRLQNDSLNLRQWVEPGPTLDASLISSMKLRDPSAFFHCVMIYDVDNSTNTDKVRWYINGQRVTSFSATVYPGSESWVNSSSKIHTIGGHYDGGGTNADSFWNGHMSQVYFLDGIAAGPEEFGYTDPLTNTWRPKKFSGNFKIIPDNQLLYNVNTGDNGFDSGTSSRTYDATGRTFTTYSAPQTANPGGFGANSAHVYKSPDGAAIDWVISTDSTDRYVWTSTDGINWTNTGVQDTDGSVVTVNTAWLAIAGGSNTTNATVTSSTAGYGLVVGHNSFYLPMDGNSPIGKDQSGNGNDWEPVAFGGSADLPKATGAIPILNTNGGGTVARDGVRTDKKTYTVTASGGKYYLDGALTPTLNAYRGGSYTFDYTGATSHPLYLSSLPDGKHNSKAYSVQFDGIGDYLGVTGNNDFDFGTGDFTIEGYFYTTNNNGTIACSQNYYSGGYNGNWLIRISTATQIAFASYDGSGNEEYTEFTAGYQTNTWHHFAFVRSGTTLTCYLDGSSVGTMTVSKSLSDGLNGILIGEDSANLNPEFNGKISNFRINKGTALYTAAFVPPSTTLTNVTGTTLLCCQDSDATTGAVLPSGSTITTNGNAAAENSSPFLYDNNHLNFGVNTSTSNTTKITIPHWATDTLYYYCNAHSGMGSSINVTTDIFKADPYAWKCMFAMASDTVDHSPEINVNSTASIFGDIHTTTLQGSRNFYGHSKKMETGGGFRIDMELTSAAANAKHKWGTGDFTIECWHYQDGAQTSWQSLMRSASYNNSGLGSVGIAHYAHGQNLIPYWGGGGNANTFGTISNCVPYKKWNHTAWTRQGGVNRIFANGVIVRTFTDSRSYDNRGFEMGDVYTWNGGYQDARIYNGVAKYTEDFVVAATEPDILPDTPSGVSGGSKLTKITEGAVSFDGTGDYLRIPNSSDFSFGSGNFCVEGFVYYTETSGNGTIAGLWNSGSNRRSWLLQIESDQKRLRGFYSLNGSSTVQVNGTTGIMQQNSWHHVALTRNGNDIRLFLNGIQIGSTTESGSFYNNSDDDIGVGSAQGGSASDPITGFLSNVRIVKGSAVYTSNFTPPTRELTNVTNTKLLCCQSKTYAVAAAVAPGTFVNDGTNYSSGSQVTGSSGLRFVDSLFDGLLSSSGASSGEGATVDLSSDNYILWTPTTGIPFTSKVEVYCYAANGYEITNYYTFNGGTETTFTGGSSGFNGISWITVATGSGTINSIKIRITRGSGNQTSVGWYAVRVDGTILINDYNGKSIAKYGSAAATNFNPFNTDINTVRGQETGYATWNPLKMGTSDVSISEGNLFWRTTSNGPDKCTYSTIGMDSGKFYWENEIVEATATGVGIANLLANQDSGPAAAHNWMYYSATGQVYLDGSASSYGSAFNTNGTIIGVAFDRDNLTLEFYKNGVSQGKLTSISGLTDSETYFAMCGDSGGASQSQVRVNFGQKPFKFPPPDGFQPMNLSTVQPEKVIARPDQYVGAITYQGITQSPRTISLPITPDLIWVKNRDDTDGHYLFDTVRGDNKNIRSDGTFTESDVSGASHGIISTIGSNSFTVRDGSSSGSNVGSTGTEDYIAWFWRAGGNKNTFNIDDVGYANASDVNMNAGALNSSLYNQSQVWSDSSSDPNSVKASGAATELFNGNISSGGVVLNQRSTSNTAYYVALDGVSISCSNSVACWMANGASTATMRINGDDNLKVAATSTTNSWVTLNFTGTITKIELGYLDGSGSSNTYYGIQVDGKLLVDSINTSVTWSNAITALSGSSLTNPPNGFDGDEGSYCDSTAGFTLDLSGHTFGTGTHTIEVKSGGASSFTVNGSTSLSGSGSGAIVWSGSHTGELNSLTSSATGASIYYIKVDGEYLLDPGQNFVSNVPSIAPTGCSVGTKQGFSIVKWTGDGSSANRTVPHGLLEAPSFVIVKPLTEARHWLIWHKDYNDDDAAMLFDTGTPAGARFGPAAPTSNVFGVYGGQGNRGTTDFIGYCWHDVPGLQKFGTYEGIGGTASGAFVELGFRPAIVWVKSIDNGSGNSHWCVFDNLRPGFNKSPAQNRLHLDQNVQEDPDRVDDGQGIDILSNGFRVRSNNWYETNASGETYIYCAWAEAPTVNLYGARTNAR